MIEPISRGVLDTRLRGYDGLILRRYPPVIATRWRVITVMGRGVPDTPRVWDMTTRWRRAKSSKSERDRGSSDVAHAHVKPRFFISD